MKILFVYREYLNDNLFVHTLIKELRKKKYIVDCSVDKFWDSKDKYDIINIQWPEELFVYNDIVNNDIISFKNRIIYLKKIGSKIVYTRHNTNSHYQYSEINQLYKLVEECADGIIHLGKYSFDEIKTSNKRIKADNFIIPHHIYENVYNENISQEEAREKLYIPKNKFIITSFGKFRNYGESVMVIKAFLSYKNKEKYLLAPRLLTFSKSKSWIKDKLFIIIHSILSRFNINVGNYDEIIDNSILPYYIIASDVIFIQRKNFLNSGNIPLAFLFKKVVIGPDCGNLKELLITTKNPLFTAQSNKSIVKALEASYNLVKQNHGEKNHLYSLENMNIGIVTSRYIEVYEFLINKN